MCCKGKKQTGHTTLARCDDGMNTKLKTLACCNGANAADAASSYGSYAASCSVKGVGGGKSMFTCMHASMCQYVCAIMYVYACQYVCMSTSVCMPVWCEYGNFSYKAICSPFNSFHSNIHSPFAANCSPFAAVCYPCPAKCSPFKAMQHLPAN